jgi:hypothetical protein
MDLTTNYLGLALKNPLIASSSPLTIEVGNIRKLEDCGAAAVVLPSIFEEQIEQEAAEVERFTMAGVDSFAEGSVVFPAGGGLSCRAGTLSRSRSPSAAGCGYSGYREPQRHH